MAQGNRDGRKAHGVHPGGSRAASFRVRSPSDSGRRARSFPGRQRLQLRGWDSFGARRWGRDPVGRLWASAAEYDRANYARV